MHVKVRLGGCVQDMVCTTQTWHMFFRDFLPETAPIIFQGQHWYQKNWSAPMVCSGWETLGWLQSYALRNLLGLLGKSLIRMGWPSGGDNLLAQSFHFFYLSILISFFNCTINFVISSQMFWIASSRSISQVGWQRPAPNQMASRPGWRLTQTLNLPNVCKQSTLHPSCSYCMLWLCL